MTSVIPESDPYPWSNTVPKKPIMLKNKISLIIIIHIIITNEGRHSSS